MWATRHKDGRNSDYVAIPGARAFQLRRRMLPGIPAATFAALDAERNAYILTLNEPTSAQGTLWSFDNKGGLRWMVKDIRPSLTSIGLSDQGSILAADGFHLHCFDSSGTCLWKTELLIETSAVMFMPQGEIVILGIDASLHLMNPENGSEVIPSLSLPSAPMRLGVGHAHMPGARKIKRWTQAFAGMGVDSNYCEQAAKRFLGIDVAAKNVPAIDPQTSRIFIAASDATAQGGTLYGIDVERDSNGIAQGWNTAFQTPMGPGCDTSPAIAGDGNSVYCADREGWLYKFDSRTGTIQWTIPLPGSSSASPNLTADGRILISIKSDILCIRETNGKPEIAWSANLIATARSAGYRQTQINSVLCVTERHAYAVGAYGLSLFGRFVPREHILFTIRLEDGSLAGRLSIDHESACTLSMDTDGFLYMPCKPIYRGMVQGFPILRRLLKQKPFYALSVFEPVEG